MTQVTPKQAMEFVENCFRIREIPYLSGKPTVGKSAIIKHVSKKLKLKLIEISLSHYIIEDITGLPTVVSGKASYVAFDTFPIVGDPIPAGYNGWCIFFDELPSASEEVLASVYSALHGHMIGGKHLHPNAVIATAGNRSTDSAIARRLPDSIITRVLGVEVIHSAPDWVEWAETPESEMHPIVAAFIKDNQDMLLDTSPPDGREENETYNNPRGWEKLSKAVYLHEKQTKAAQKAGEVQLGARSSSGKITPQIALMFKAAVSALPAIAFTEFYDEATVLAQPWEIAQAPMSAIIPPTAVGRADLVEKVAEYFITAQNMSRDAILKFMNRMNQEESELFISLLTSKLPKSASNTDLLVAIKKRLVAPTTA